MENQHQKWVNFAFLATAALLAFILYSYGIKAASLFELESKLRGMGVRTPVNTVLSIASIAIGGLAFLILARHQKANAFMNEVVDEMAKVSWPTQKETTDATIVVIVTVVIAGMALGFMDFVWTKALQKLF